MKNIHKISLALTAFVMSTQLAQAQPRNANGTVTSGAATIVDTDANTTTINQTSDIAHIDWSDFDIAAGQTVQFNVPRAASFSVNRVTSGVASTIAGALNSNGKVFLINEHGMHFSNTAQVNVSTLVASTLDTFNAQADAAQYAEITFDSSQIIAAANPNSVFVAIAPFIGFYNTVGRLSIEGGREANVISANRATVTISGVDNTVSYDIPDVQPDVVVPMGKKLGIEAIGTAAANSFIEVLGFYDSDIIAKAVSVGQNIEALINLDGTAMNGSDQYITLGGFHAVEANPTVADWGVDFYSAGNILMQGQVKTSAIAYVELPDGTPVSLPVNLRIHAEKNLFIDSFHSGANNVHIEAGNNLILNAMVAPPAATTEPLFLRGIFGERTIKLGSGTLSVENTEVNVGALAAIDTYAAGSFGHVNHEWVAVEQFDGSEYAAINAGAIDAPVAVTTVLEADQIDINTDLDYTGSVTARDFKVAYGYDFIPGTPLKYFYDPGVGNEETAPLTLKATGDININANINTASMGDVNLALDGTYTLAPTKTVLTGTNALNVAALSAGPPPPPAPPVVPPVVPADPDPVPVDVVDLIESITPETVAEVKDVFFDDFAEGSQEAVDQVVSVDAVEAETLNVQLEAPTIADAKDKGDVKAVAADCKDNVCVVLDEENTLLTVEATLLRNERSFFARLVDRAVNLRGMVDVIRF